MSSKTAKNALQESIVVGQEIHGKWSPPRTAHGIVKSLGKTKVKITLTQDFTKTILKGMCVDIYFQNTWTTGDEPPENWKENFKWKTINPDKKGSRKSTKKVGKSYADYKESMTIKEEYSPEEIIKIALQYEKIKSQIPNGIDKYVEELDAIRAKKLQEEKEQREKEQKEQREKEEKKKEFMAQLWEQNKDKFNEMFEEKPVQEVMEQVEEECSLAPQEENWKNNFLATKPNKSQMIVWINENLEEPEIDGLNKNQLKKYIKEY